MTYWIFGLSAWLAFWCVFIAGGRLQRRLRVAGASPLSLFDEGNER